MSNCGGRKKMKDGGKVDLDKLPRKMKEEKYGFGFRVSGFGPGLAELFFFVLLGQALSQMVLPEKAQKSIPCMLEIGHFCSRVDNPPD